MVSLTLSGWLFSSSEIASIAVGDRKQLFIDHKFIASSENVTLTSNPPQKEGVVLKGEFPWENGLLNYGSVIDDNGFYKMWYEGMEQDGLKGPRRPFHTLYATSTDGIHWEKPILGLTEFDGSRANNIVLGSDDWEKGGAVFLDPKAPPDQRFKRVIGLFKYKGPDRGGLYIIYSGDGVRWKLHEPAVFPFNSDTDNQAFYDSRIQKYVAYVRMYDPWRKVGRVETDDIMKPWPFHPLAKPNYGDMGEKYLPFPSREIQAVISYDDSDPKVTDIYNPGVGIYPWADDAYFAFPSVFGHFPQPGGGKTFEDYKKYKGPNPDAQGRYRNDGDLDIQMAVSRDGIYWDRMDRRPYIELGPDGGPDSKLLLIMPGSIRRGGEIYQYYIATNYSHGELGGFKRTRNLGAVMRVVQRLDGFVSVDTDYHGGSLTTPSVIFQGHHLELNLKTASTGEACVEMEDEEGKPIEGYAKEDCDEVVGNYVAKTITWWGNQDVSKLAGKPVRLHILMRNAKLYAFQFAE